MWHENLSYKITDKILTHIVNVERNLAIVNQNETSIKLRDKLRKEVLFDDLFALSNCLNFNLTLGEIKKISIGKDVEQKEAVVLSNVRQIFEYVQNNYRKEPIVFNFHFIQHVIKLLHSNVLEVWDVGKIRSGAENVENLYELPNQKYFNQDVINLLAEVVVWVETEEDVHPIIKACIFMMFINNVSPFVGMNFISSLVFFRLILEKYNFGNNFSIPLFKVFCSNNFSVRESINKSLVSESKTSLTEIITNISVEINELVTQLKNNVVQFDYQDIKTNTNQLDLNERQLKLLKLLQQKVNIKRREYIKLFKVSPMTAYRDLNYLLSQKLLVVSGEGKSTKYTLYTKA